MVDAQELSVGDIRLELESLRRDVACLTREMRKVKTALFKLRGSTAESSGEEGKVGAACEELLKAPPVTEDMEELGTVVMQSQSPTCHFGEYPRILGRMKFLTARVKSIENGRSTVMADGTPSAGIHPRIATIESAFIHGRLAIRMYRLAPRLLQESTDSSWEAHLSLGMQGP